MDAMEDAIKIFINTFHIVWYDSKLLAFLRFHIDLDEWIVQIIASIKEIRIHHQLFSIGILTLKFFHGPWLKSELQT
jgi:hypothetical protein